MKVSCLSEKMQISQVFAQRMTYDVITASAIDNYPTDAMLCIVKIITLALRNGIHG